MLLVGAAILIVFAVFTHSWWAFDNDDGEPFVNLGVKSMELCIDGCEATSYEAMEMEKEKTWVTFGRLTFFSGLAAALALLVAAGIVATRTKIRGPAHPARLAVLITAASMLCGIFFFVLRPDMGSVEPSVGYGFPLFLIGAISGTVGGSLVAPRRSESLSGGAGSSLPAAAVQPRQPFQGPGSRPVPACQHCEAPMEWRAEFERYFCQRCRTYA